MDLLEQLHDIEGLDFISQWPLAIGWWVLIAIGFIILGTGICWLIGRLLFRRSWKYDTLNKLNILEQGLNETAPQELVLLLSEYLRRIALKRFPRTDCAGLVGSEWLKWLSQHDPKQFDWEQKGILLVEGPYAPALAIESTDQIKEMIHAARNWVR
jgi:hypothetical protein